MKKIKENKKVIIFLILIILVQVFFKIYLDYNKEDFFIDELYSYGLMNYKQAFIFEEENFRENWHNKEYFDDYLTVSRDEALVFSPVYYNQEEDYHPPFYYLLLRIATSFTIGYFTKWSGLILNILIFIGSAIMVFLIGKRLFKSDKYALLLIFIYGFSKFSSENTLFIRMYQLLELQMLFLVYWYLKNYQKEKLGIKDLIIFGFLIVLGTLTQYYYIIFLIGVLIIALARYIRKKQIKNILKIISVFILAQIIIYMIFPKYIDQLAGNSDRSSSGNISISEKIEKSIDREKQYFKIIEDSMFHLKISYLLVGMLIVGGILLIIKLMQNKKAKITLKSSTDIISIIVPTLFYWYIVSTTSPYIDLRYMLPLFFFILIVIFYLLQKEIEMIIKNRKHVFILTTVIGVFYATSFWYKPHYRYQYIGNKEIIETIKEYKDIPCIYLYTHFDVLENDFVQNINYVRQFENVYIMDKTNFSVNKLRKILEGKDMSQGIIIYDKEKEIGDKIYRIIRDMDEFTNYKKIVELKSERIIFDEIYLIY